MPCAKLVLLALAIVVSLAACGSARRAPRSGTPAAARQAGLSEGTASVASESAAPGHAIADSDDDDVERLPNDDNNSAVRDFGSPATAAEAHAISALLRRYYATAAAGNGALACSMILASIVKAVPLNYGVYGPTYMRGGKTCAQVLVRLFAHEHRRLLAETAHMTVTSVRLQGDLGLAMLGFSGLRERQISLQREHVTWKLAALLDGELP
jgi:hypothetical protein